MARTRKCHLMYPVHFLSVYRADITFQFSEATRTNAEISVRFKGEVEPFLGLRCFSAFRHKLFQHLEPFVLYSICLLFFLSREKWRNA